jgi:hypothetical protein
LKGAMLKECMRISVSAMEDLVAGTSIAPFVPSEESPGGCRA